MVRQFAMILWVVLGLLPLVAATNTNSNTSNEIPPPPPPGEGASGEPGLPPGPPRGGSPNGLPPLPPDGEKHQKKGGPPPFFVQDERFKKMLDLALLPESDVEQSMDKLPMTSKMSDQEKEKFLEHIRNFRNRIRKSALEEAQKMGITVSPDKESEFIKDFWEKRIQMEKKLNDEIEPRRKKLMGEIKDELAKKYGTTKTSGQ